MLYVIWFSNKAMSLKKPLYMLAGIPQLVVRTDSTLKKFMFLQQSNDIYVVNRQINTRAHDAIVFETCIPKIGKHKTRTMYRGIQL